MDGVSGCTRKPDPPRLRPRAIGADWVFHFYTADDVSDWDINTFVAEVRFGAYSTAPLLASTEASDGADMTYDTAFPDLGAEASTLGPTGGDLWLVIQRDVTAAATPGDHTLQLWIAAPSLGGFQPIGTFTVPVADPVAVPDPP